MRCISGVKFIYIAHVITLFSQFDFALDQVSEFVIETFAVHIVGFKPTFVVSSSLTNESFKRLINNVRNIKKCTVNIGRVHDNIFPGSCKKSIIQV